MPKGEKSVLPEVGIGLTDLPKVGGARGHPIPTGEGRLSPPITTGTPTVFHLPASLRVYCLTSRFSAFAWSLLQGPRLQCI